MTMTKVKALPNGDSMVQSVQARPLLLDECVTIRLANEADKARFLHSIDLVGRGAPDFEVMRLAQEQNCILVTRDKKLAYRCIENNINVAYLDVFSNKIRVMSYKNCTRDRHRRPTIAIQTDDEIMPIHIELTIYFLPIFSFKIEVRDYQKRVDLARFKIRMRRRLYRQLKKLRKCFQRQKTKVPQPSKPLKLFSCSLCTLCFDKAVALDNHLICNHNQAKVTCSFCNIQCRSMIRLRNHVRNDHKIARLGL